MTSTRYRGRNANHAYYNNTSELAGTTRQELQADVVGNELEACLPSSELPAEPCYDHGYSHSGAVYNAHTLSTDQTKGHDPWYPDAPIYPNHNRVASADGMPGTLVDQVERSYIPPKPSHQYLSTSTPSEGSSFQQRTRSLSNSLWPLMTNTSEQTRVPPIPSCPTLSRSTTVTISPSNVSPISPHRIIRDSCHTQYASKPDNSAGLYPSSLSASSSFFVDPFSPSNGDILPAGDNNVSHQIMSPVPECSPVSIRRTSTALGSREDLSPYDFSPYEECHFTSAISELGTSLSPSYHTAGLLSPFPSQHISDVSRSTSFPTEGHGPSLVPIPWASNQLQRSTHVDCSDVNAILNEQNGNDAPPPGYTLSPTGLPQAWDIAAAHVAQRKEDEMEPDVSPVHTERQKPMRSSISCPKLFTPLACGQCEKTFTGAYQKVNRSRHIKHHHSTTRRIFRCRDPTCSAEYKRDDARRKHEWKKHRNEESKPEKRRKEKR